MTDTMANAGTATLWLNQTGDDAKTPESERSLLESLANWTRRSSAVFKKRHPEVGARPGTLMIADDAVAPRITIISYNAAEVEQREVGTVAELAKALESEHVSWVDVQGFGDERLIREIGKLFALHPLVMEDVINLPQRPKAEVYGDQLLLIARMVDLEGDSGIDIEQISIVLGEHYVLTFQERYGDVLDPIRRRIHNGKGPIRRSDSGFLAYALLDTIVDGYYPVLERLGEHLERLEEAVLDNPGTSVLRVLHRTKNMLMNLRRAIWPQREALNSLIRDEHQLLSDDVRTFLRDTYDHCIQTADVIDMYREMTTSLMNTYLSVIANRTNDVMKALTIMASIFIPLTFLAGIYGMNFEHMPELHYRWSYPIVWLTMISVVGCMLYYFRRKGWIGGGQELNGRIKK